MKAGQTCLLYNMCLKAKAFNGSKYSLKLWKCWSFWRTTTICCCKRFRSRFYAGICSLFCMVGRDRRILGILVEPALIIYE